MTNNGTISISHSDEEGLYFIGGTFENHDSLKIDYVARSGILMDFPFTSTSQLNNHAGGFMEISNAATTLTTTSGIRLGDPGNIFNAGQMVLDNCGNFAMLISDEAQLEVVGGVIQLKNMPEDGILVDGMSVTSMDASSELSMIMTTGTPLEIGLGAIWDISGIQDIQ